MPSYRLYFLEGGRVRSANPFEADDDPAALMIADGLRGDDSAELWNLDRVVRKYDGAPLDPAPCPLDATASLSPTARDRP